MPRVRARAGGQTIFVADAHRDDGKRFVVRADEKLTAFMELELACRRLGSLLSKRWLCETPFEFLESFRKQDAHKKRLTRNSPSETVAPRNRGLVMDRHADGCD